MLTPPYLDKLPETMVSLIDELQNEIIADITKRMVKGNYTTPSTQWLTYKASQLRLSSREITKIIAKQEKIREREVRRLYTDAVKTALAEDAEIYRLAMEEKLLPKENGEKLDIYFRSIAFNDTFKKGLKNTGKLMRNLTNSMASAANRTLSDAMDLAWLEVANGAFTPDEAIFKAVSKLAAESIYTVKYKSGRADQTDTAVRRAILTSINKTAGDMQLDLAKDMGCDLVEVTSHLGARPTHAEWQGQIYSLSGKHPKYKPFSVTGYGTGDGLCGWNCRHSFFPYFEGISLRASKPDFTDEENKKEYELSQKQRSYERAIRKTKRELISQDEMRTNTSDPALKEKAEKAYQRKAALLKEQEKRLDDFCKQNKLLKDNSRVRTYGFGHSEASKASWAAKNYNKAKNSQNSLTNGGNSGTMNTNTIPKTIEECLTHKDIKKYFSSKGVIVSPLVSTLDFATVKESMKGIESVINEFPKASSALVKIGTFKDPDSDGVMRTNYYGVIKFNNSYYGVNSIFPSKYDLYANTHIARGFSPETNNVLLSNGRHEMGHILEKALILKNQKYATETDRVSAWNKAIEAEQVVRQAYGNLIVKHPKLVKGKHFDDLRNDISEYSLYDMHETLAEAVDDCMTNGSKAAPLSIEIFNILKGELS